VSAGQAATSRRYSLLTPRSISRLLVNNLPTTTTLYSQLQLYRYIPAMSGTEADHDAQIAQLASLTGLEPAQACRRSSKLLELLTNNNIGRTLLERLQRRPHPRGLSILRRVCRTARKCRRSRRRDGWRRPTHEPQRQPASAAGTGRRTYPRRRICPPTCRRVRSLVNDQAGC
jgi:hypothetical protein